MMQCLTFKDYLINCQDKAENYVFLHLLSCLIIIALSLHKDVVSWEPDMKTFSR